MNVFIIPKEANGYLLLGVKMQITLAHSYN